MLNEFKLNVDNPFPGDSSLSFLLADENAPPYYKFSESQFRDAKQAIKDLLEYVGKLAAMSVCKDPDDAATRPSYGGHVRRSR